MNLADGRLSLDEFAERTDLVYAAKTARDLDVCFRDLPPDVPAAVDERREAQRGYTRRNVSRFAIVNAACVGVWVAGGAHAAFWPAWVFLGTGLLLARRLTRGPSAPRPKELRDSDRDRDRDRRSRSTPRAVGRGSNRHDARVLATCLFVDVVGSTELAVSMGDAKWGELLKEHQGKVQRRVRRWNGREIFTRGDEVVARFKSATGAVSCASAIRDAAHGLGLEVRAGLHTGEVQRQGSDVSGIALHIGQRISALAAPGEILVSSTVRDLVTGSGIEFEPRGEAELKGVPGTWQLFAVSAVSASAAAPESEPPEDS